MPTTHSGLCNFCDSVCGLEIETEGLRVVAIRGDKQNSFSRGHVCPKGIAQQDLHHDPDRLRSPLRKKGDGWEEISWDEALEQAGSALAEVQRRHGPNALAVYWGNPASHDYGALATGLVDVLNIVTGNLGRPGGAMFCSPAVDLLWVSRLTRQPGDFNRWKSRVSGLPEFNGEFPVAALAEEMETPGPGQVKALVTLAGNPILSLPNGRRLDRAFAGLEYMVSIDYYVNETTRHAHLILPPVSPLEADHYPILELAMGIRDFTHYAPAVFAKPEGAKHNWEIMTDLVWSLDRHRGPVAAAAGRVKRKLLYWLHPYRQLKLLLRLGPRKLSIETLLAAEHGIDLGPLLPGADKVICRKNGRIDLLPPELEADVDRLQKKLEAGPGLAADELILVSRRTPRSINSWMHNSHRLVKGKDQCTLMVHPDDAARLGLTAGGTAVVSSRVGEVRVPVEVTDEMMPGVASMAFGWGHDRPGARLSIAGQHPGVSMNDILDETLYDRVSGISVLDGVPVKVRPGP